MAQKEYHLPEAQNKLPVLLSEFQDLNAKGEFVNSVIGIATKAMTDGDHFFQSF